VLGESSKHAGLIDVTAVYNSLGGRRLALHEHRIRCPDEDQLGLTGGPIPVRLSPAGFDSRANVFVVSDRR
jgi:hypothetical protein